MSRLREGERAVILVRAETVERWLEQYVLLLREGIWPGHVAQFTHFETQRLRSACERALGTRGRPVDQMRNEGGSRPQTVTAPRMQPRGE